MNQQYLIYLMPAIVSFGLAYVLIPLFRELSLYLDFQDRPGEHKSHEEATPLLGGVAVFLAVWGALFFVLLQGWFQVGTQVRGVFLGSLLILLMGLLDDAYHLSAFVKFLVQVGAALILLLYGVSVTLFIGPNIFTGLITILWVVGITNSFNLLDNMDGLAPGVAAISALIFSIISLRQGDLETFFLSITLAGALAAFLRFNFHPAEIFLGDAGSGFLGFYLSALAVAANYIEHSQLPHLPIISPLLIFSVPLFDTFSVMAIRVMEGRSVWDADNRHFSHRLVNLGLSEKTAVLVIYFLTFTVGSLAILMGSVGLNDSLLILTHAIAIFALIILLEYASAAGDNN
ncbi:MAG: glycosyltransferase family 4 protein [bacterium]